jgi:hypothetical protein
VTQLAAVPKPEGVLSSEIESEMSDLREQFRSDSLPIDDDLLEFSLDDATHAAHEGYRFVHQLKLIDAGNRRVAAAIRDFYRAFEQRSRWVREDLLLVGDLSRYEKRLIEEWELAFDSKKDELGEAAAEADMCRMARSILAWAEQVTIPIRPGVTEPFVVRGSYHMLADEDPPRIGWHPEFLSRLSGILSAAAVLAPSVAARGAAK